MGNGERKHIAHPALRTVGLLVLLLLIAAVAGRSEPVLISGAISTANHTGERKTDFEVVVISDERVDMEGPERGGMLWVDGVLASPPRIADNDSTRVTLGRRVLIPDGASVVVTYVGSQDGCSQFGLLASFGSERASTERVAVLGWRVVCSGWTFFKNANRTVIAYDDLRIFQPGAITFDSMLSALETSRGHIGWAGPAAGDVRAAGGDTYDDAGTAPLDAFKLDEAGFLLAKLDVRFANPSFSESEATILIGHERQATCGL